MLLAGAIWAPSSLWGEVTVFAAASLSTALQEIADQGIEAFYEGEFARNYVKRAAADGGKISQEQPRMPGSGPSSSG